MPRAALTAIIGSVVLGFGVGLWNAAASRAYWSRRSDWSRCSSSGRSAV